jgi:HEAT repeat protein
MPKPSIFLSYSHLDKRFARRIAGDLMKYGVNVWIDEGEIRLGDSLIEKISQAIVTMDYLAVVLSPASVKSEWVKIELEIAMTQAIKGKRVKVLPLRIADCKIPGFLEGKLYADFTNKKKYYFGLKTILERLDIMVDLEDQTIKFLQDQLDAFQKAYKINSTLIIEPRFMAKLYTNRRKIKISEDKHALILGSSLIGENGLGWYFLRNLEKSKIRELLKELLNHPNSELRKRALEFLGEIMSPDDREAVLMRLQDPDPSIKERAVEVLATLGDRETIIMLLKARDKVVRASALWEFSRVALPQDRKLIIQLLQLCDNARDEVPPAQNINQFKQVTPRKNQEIIARQMSLGVDFTRGRALRVLGKIALPQDREMIIKYLQDNDPHIPFIAVDVLARLGDREAIIELLHSQDHSVRGEAFRKFETMALPQDRELLQGYSKVKDGFVWEKALTILAKLGDREAMMELMRDRSSAIREEAIGLFGEIALPQDRKLIIELLDDDDPYMQASAANALSKVALPQDQELIAKLLQNENPYIKWSGANALTRIGQQLELEELEKFLDYLAKKAQNWGIEQVYILTALSQLDQILFSPVKPKKRSSQDR